MTSPSDTSTGDEQRDDTHDTPDQQGGQVSETSAMTPEGGADSTPGTDDGVPPAEDSATEPGGPPSSYGD